MAVHSSCGNNHRSGLIGAALADHLFHGTQITDLRHLILDEFGSKLVRMLTELGPQLETAHAGESRIIIYLISGQHLAAAYHFLLDHGCLKSGTAGINCRRQSGRAGPYNHKIVSFLHS